MYERIRTPLFCNALARAGLAFTVADVYADKNLVKVPGS